MKSSHMVTSDDKIKISINISERLLAELDSYRKADNLSRSIWVTSAIMEKIASIKQKGSP